MQNLLKAAPLCDEVLIYDNTTNYELIAKITNGALDLQKNVVWFNNLISNKIQQKPSQNYSYDDEYSNSSRFKPQ